MISRPNTVIQAIYRTFSRLDDIGKPTPTLLEVCAYIGDPTVSCGEIKHYLTIMEERGIIESFGPFWKVKYEDQEKTTEDSNANVLSGEENTGC